MSKDGREKQNEYAEIQLRAARMAGGFLRQLKKSEGGRPQKNSPTVGQVSDYAEVLDRDKTNYAAEIMLRSARGAGLCLSKLEKSAGGDRKSPKYQKGELAHLISEYAEVLDRTGTTRQDASRWQTIEAEVEGDRAVVELKP